MKKKVIQICSLVGLLIGLMVSAQAQTGTQYRAHIPFDFNVGNKTLPAGDYVIGLTNQAFNQDMLTIREAKSGEAKIVQLVPRAANGMSEISKLVFNRYNDQYFLAEMITPTLKGIFQKTKVEGSLAKKQKALKETVAMKK